MAEARGLIAGASRIVAALDDVPAAGEPAWGSPSVIATRATGVARARSAWRKLRVTPARAAIAATLLVAVGITLTYDRTAVDSEAARKVLRQERAATTMSVPPGGGPATAAAPAATATPRHDGLLDSALKRNIAQSQPPRAVERTPGYAPPSPEPLPSGGAAAMDPGASARVGAARASMRAARDSLAGRAPDMLKMEVAAPAAPATPSRVALLTGTRCYRVESANATPAAWGPVALPLVIAVDSGSNLAHVYTAAGERTEVQARVTRAGGDSLLFALRRLGYEGTLALGSPSEVRAGVMRSRSAVMELGESVVTAADAREDKPAASARSAKAAPGKAATPSPSASGVAAATETRSAVRAAPAVPVVASRVRCP